MIKLISFPFFKIMLSEENISPFLIKLYKVCEEFAHEHKFGFVIGEEEFTEKEGEMLS